jgi:hypothetical protein
LSEAFYAALCAGRSVASAYKQAIVMCGLRDRQQTTRDLTRENEPAPDDVAVLRHRPDVDPDRIHLVPAAQPMPPSVQPRNLRWGIIGASVVVVASIATAAILGTKLLGAPTSTIADAPLITAADSPPTVDPSQPLTPQQRKPSASEPPPATAPPPASELPPASEPPAPVAQSHPQPAPLRTARPQAPRPTCRDSASKREDETVRGPRTIVASTVYAAFLYAKCLDGPCLVQILDRGTPIQKFPLSKNQEWTGYHRLLGHDLAIVHGVAQVIYCTLDRHPNPL